jgi:hypothetical protein
VIAPATSANRLVLPDAVTTAEPDLVTILVGEDSPTVDLLLADPAVAVERLADKRGMHR